MRNITVGADPEIFVRLKQSGKFVSAGGMVPGTKDEPHPVKKGAIQVDGTALEFNIEPASSSTEFLENITTVLGELKARVGKQHELAFVPVAYFDKPYFDALPISELALGCEPDYDAYTGLANPKPNTLKPMRTASGHIHVGGFSSHKVMHPDHFLLCRNIAMQLDIALFVPSIMWDPDNERRELYGQPGAFRPKTYGVEYRVLSSRWLACPEITQWVAAMTLWAVQKYFEGNRLFDKFTVSDMPERLMTELELMGAPSFPWTSKEIDVSRWIKKPVKEAPVACQC